MAHFVQATSSQIEGCSNNAVAVDLSKFQEVNVGLKSLQMFESYFPAFIENNVNDEALLCLEKDDIKDLITKIGDRARFMKWLNVHKSKHEMKEENIKPTTKQKVICTKCNGSGSFDQHIEYNENVNCARCNGNGGWSMNTEQEQNSTCSSCNGKGTTVQKCDGSYHYLANCSDDEWRSKINERDCSFCDAGFGFRNRECQSCRGKGTISSYVQHKKWIPCGTCCGVGNTKTKKYKIKSTSCTTCNGNVLKLG
eukprot:428934_1